MNEKELTPIVHGNLDGIKSSFKKDDLNNGIVEISLSFEKLTAPRTAPWGNLTIPRRLSFSITIDPDNNDFVVRFGFNENGTARSHKVFAFKEESVSSTNTFAINIVEGKIISATLNGQVLEDITPYSWEHNVDLYKTHKQIMESLFGSSWFQTDINRKVNHPAYRR